jgi:hypothetical protein
MDDAGNRAKVERYAAALPDDMQALSELRHPDYVEDWPQSGERLRGHEGYQRVHDQFPGGLPEGSVTKVTGSEDKWVVSPSYTLLRIAGTGDEYTLEVRVTYPDASVWYLVTVLTVKDGLVHRQRTYFAPTYPAPEWRVPLVERIDPVG